ncbi:hypothetical protein GIB67_034953 [Kingdonia uniflora]|uniref:non-specific serine/threonine protein kinase n=1 Tax=Kingdonia uniflora TaxID=39325 RepID=A0A7J7NHG1_9MAGN|nr:hypothetical protein GIB67_034953 [Kingdonia uniflora]
MSERNSPPLLFLTIILLSLSLFISPTLSDDAAILQKLLGSFSSPPSGWSGSNPCKWSGINCDGSNRVTSIDISSKSISGVLPPEINELTQLKTLSFQQNKLSGAIPDLSNLVNLQELFLDSNNFTSVGSLSGLSSLQTLSLSNNVQLDPWVLPVDLTQSESLVTLYVSNVNLYGWIPEFLGNFSSLQNLRLSYNNLTGALPASLAGSGVMNLWLNNQVNGLSGRIDVLGAMSQLSQVWLHKNAFSGGVPDLSNCTSLFDLQLRDNQLTGVVPLSVISLPRLVNVSLDNNKLQGPYPEFGSGVKVSLGSTNSFCNTKPGPCDPQVTELLAVAGALGYPMTLAESWEGNDACNQWTFISCSDGKVTIINFAKQHFSGTISPEIAKLTSLKTLSLNDNNLSGEIPASLANLTGLENVDVSNNNLVGKIPELPNVKTLKTSGNPLLGINATSPPSSDTNPGSGSNATSPGSSNIAPKSKSSVSVGMIAGIVIAVVAVVGLGILLYYCKCFSNKTHQKFGPVPVNPPNGAKVNGYVGAVSELQSQSSGENNGDVQYFEGGNVAISIQLLRQVTDNFSENNILGKGGFGVVYKGELHDGTQIAVKRMESGIMGTKGLKEFQAEIAVLSKVRHRHLVALLGYCVNGNERLLVYEYMPQGTLGQHLFDREENRHTPLTWKQRLSIALDVARGVEYLHSLAQQSFIHRDLKPSNILLGDDMRAKVSDFGLVKNAPDGKYSVETRLAGTFGYLAPEYAATGRVTRKVDVYAFGVVLMEMITGRKALEENMPEEQSHLVTWFRRVLIDMEKNLPIAIDPTLHPDDETYKTIITVSDLAGHCTARDPSQRPDMGHAVNILGPLVEQWKPSSHEEEEAFGIDYPAASLPLRVQQWMVGESTSTDVYATRGPITSLTDTTTGSSVANSMLSGPTCR